MRHGVAAPRFFSLHSGVRGEHGADIRGCVSRWPQMGSTGASMGLKFGKHRDVCHKMGLGDSLFM